MRAASPSSLSLRLKLLVVGVLYFAEGVPFGFVYTTLTYYFRSQGLPLEQIGILSLLGLAWSLKVLWSPLADRFGSRAAWLVPAQAAVIFSLLGLAYLAPGVSLTFWVLVGLLCLASATQDLAVDAYTIDLLETQELGLANGVRIGAYRVGLIASGGGVLILSDVLGWSPAFVGVAVLMAAMVLTVVVFSPFHLPRPELVQAKPEAGAFSQIRQSFKGLSRHPHIWAIIVFTLTYKAGDAMLGTMVSPFWRDMGFSGTQFGLASITVGKVPAILGGILGGFLTARWGISRALWLLGIFQACSILGYWLAAVPGSWRYTIYLATLGESLAGQMGSAAFMAFLMSLCDKRFSASHYAFLSMLFGLGGRTFGYLGGWAAAYFGYATFFFLSFLAAWPAFALLPWILPTVRGIEGREGG
jgi:PAT family beta-lactamase induction signal transducer AmpG